jgi:peptidoglycan/xylan/chitin deacetylase (PgdA/CDA1 family)
MDLKHRVFRTGLTALSVTGAARLLSAKTRGLGAVLMFHHVRPARPRAFDPHGILEITPEFLDATLQHVKMRGYDIIPIAAMAERIRSPIPGKPFVVLTFDDGYRDNAEYALPVLKRHAAPFTVFAVPGFADATAPLWWLDLEDAVAKTRQANPMAAFKAASGSLRPDPALQQKIAEVAAKAGLDPLARTGQLCLDWDGLRKLADEPLCTIGAHTLTHPLLGTQDEAVARHEMAHSKVILEERLQRPVLHMAYPVGDALAAGQREFRLARELGFETGVTTRPGVIFPEHGAHLHALPRLSVNGLYQSIADFDVLLSGAAFWLFNQGRKLNVA